MRPLREIEAVDAFSAVIADRPVIITTPRERGRTTESSARRAYQRLALTDDLLADPTSAYPGEMPSLLKKAADLAGDHGAGLPALAEALKLSPAQVRALLGDADQRPVLRLIGGQD